MFWLCLAIAFSASVLVGFALAVYVSLTTHAQLTQRCPCL